MREKKRAFAIFLLLAALLLALPRPSAEAADDVATVTAQLGAYVRVFIDMPGGETLREHTVLEGHPAPGLLLRAEGEGLALVGTPTETGEWVILVSYRTDAGEGELRIEQYVVPAATPSPSPTPSPTPTPTPGPVPTPSPTAAPTPTPEPTPVPTPEPTPEPTLAPTPEGLPVITKHPSGETVTPGGTAIFVARAQDAVKIDWYLAPPDGGAPTELSKASALFPDLLVYGADAETLSLSGIPESMNTWQVECRFTGATGAVSTSSRATVTVKQGALAAPAFSELPQGAELYSGESVTLSSWAIPAEGSEVKYQWYSTKDYNLASIQAIQGATEPTFTPPIVEGTTYYCVGVKNVKGYEESSPAYSPLTAVTCISQVRAHVHDWSGPWRFGGQTHWRECSCGQRAEESYHDFRYTVTRKATARREGQRTGVCAVCGYQITETVPASGAGRAVLYGALGLVALLLVLGGLYVWSNVRRRRRYRQRRAGTYNGTRRR